MWVQGLGMGMWMMVMVGSHGAGHGGSLSLGCTAAQVRHQAHTQRVP